MSNVSAEVAADFKDALQDLKYNSRPEISNLTIIAKENTEHAEAISNVLENHIRTAQPAWKLPALYVLDSIVKNVGTPYTVYLGRNLFKTFMDAYTLVDANNRKAMDGLLKTWKQPVPESMNQQPVFPPDTTRDIENALIRIRTSQVQAQALAQRPIHGLPARPSTNPATNGHWRNTPTPPQHAPRYAAPNDPRVRQQYPPQNQYGQYPSATPPIPVPSAQPFAPQGQFSTATPPPPIPSAQPFQPPVASTPVSSVDLESLKADLAKLTLSNETSLQSNPADQVLAGKVKALKDLQHVLNTQTLPPQQLQAIRDQVHVLSQQVAPAPAPVPMPAFSPPVPFNAHPFPPPQPFVQPPQQSATPSFPPATPNLAQLLASVRPPPSQAPTPATPVNPTQALADMLRRMSTPQVPTTPTATAPLFPPPPFPPVPPPSAPPAPAAVPTPPPTTNLAALLANLGKTPAAPTPQQAPPPLPFVPQPGAPATASGNPEWLANLLKNIPLPPAGTPSAPVATPAVPMARQVSGSGGVFSGVELTTASMKQPRFHLIAKLYNAKPNMCATCGRRFENTPEGKEKKARHMDWHFKVKDPDAQKRGVHRSWYISEREWMEYREVDETSPEQATRGAKAAAAPKVEPKDKYVRVPTDPVLREGPCPICQEKFDQNMKWHVDANDFVWMDAVQVGGKIYHATCWEEYSKGAGVVAPSTPDSVLGKRKADNEPGSGKKLRMG